MRVQSIGQNNYNNRQTCQNTKNQPAFKNNITCLVEFKKGVNAPFHLPNRFRETFLHLAAQCRFISPSNIFVNRAFWARLGKNGSPTNQGIIRVVDTSSAFAQDYLAKLPTGTEAKYKEWQELHKAFREGRLDKLPADISREYADCRKLCGRLAAEVSEKDPSTILFHIDANTLNTVANTPQNVHNKQGKILTIPLWFEF